MDVVCFLVTAAALCSYANVSFYGVGGSWRKFSGELVASGTGERMEFDLMLSGVNSMHAACSWRSWAQSAARWPCRTSASVHALISVPCQCPADADTNARLAVLFDGPGTMQLDMVSLLPTGALAGGGTGGRRCTSRPCGLLRLLGRRRNKQALAGSQCGCGAMGRRSRAHWRSTPNPNHAVQRTCGAATA